MTNKSAVLLICLLVASIPCIPTPAGHLDGSSQHDGVSRTADPKIDRMEKYVLQVGINDYMNVPKLRGCVRDVENVRKVLTEKFAVPPDNILALTDRQATHEAIISAFRSQLIENARKQPGALVIFQYSGHGSRVPDQNGDKADHMDVTLVPVNSRDIAGKHFDIVDDEIRELFNELTRYTSNVLFIFDCCHSGNPTRAGAQAREIPIDTRPQPPEKALTQAERAAFTQGQNLIGMLSRDERYISIAASMPHELAFEVDAAGNTEGALTHFLVERFKQATPETTYRELMARVANDVTAQYPAQHPQCEGDRGRPVLAGSANREDPFIRIDKVAGNRITMSAGSVQGLTEGTILSIYAPNAYRLTGKDKRLTTAKVTKVGALDSNAELLEPVSITTEAKAVILSKDFVSTRTRVSLDLCLLRGSTGLPPTCADLKFISDITDLLRDDEAIELVFLNGNAWDRLTPIDAYLMRGPFGSTFRNKAALAPVRKVKGPPRGENAEVYYLTGPDRSVPLFDFVAHPKDVDGAMKVADAIKHLANQRILRAIHNATSDLNNQLLLKVERVIGKKNPDGYLQPGARSEPLELGKMQQDYQFNQGEMFKFSIENNSPRDLYVILFDITTEGAIQILYPPPGAAGVLIRSRDKPLNLPQVYEVTGPPGYETFKIIATTVPKSHDDFAFLEQGVVRGAKVIPVAIQQFQDWTTSQINFVVSDRVNK
ncbi:MAG: caspase family protein [Blastocatellia bacterium]